MVDPMSSRDRTGALIAVADIVWGIGLLVGVVAVSLLLFDSGAGVPSDLPSFQYNSPRGGEGPNWADVVLAVGTAVLAAATCELAGAALWGLRSLSESRRVRNATDFRTVRGKIHHYAGLGASRNRLKDKLFQVRETKNPEYRELLTEPSFVEDLQILVKNHGIDFKIVKDSLGYIFTADGDSYLPGTMTGGPWGQTMAVRSSAGYWAGHWIVTATTTFNRLD